MKRRLSPNQLAWLRSLAAGVNPWDSKRGRSGRGGSTQTARSLFERGLTTILGDITDKGRALLKELEPPAPLKLTGVRYIGYANRRVDVHARLAIRNAKRSTTDERIDATEPRPRSDRPAGAVRAEPAPDADGRGDDD